MCVLCYDNPDCNNLFAFEVSAAYYDQDVSGLVLCPAYGSFDDFCFPDLHYTTCNTIISVLYRDGFYDLRTYGELQLYSDIVKKE